MADYPTSAIQHIPPSTASPEVIANANSDASGPAFLFGIKSFAALTVNIYGGKYSIAGVPTAVAEQPITLTASTTNYVRILTSSGVVSFVTSIPASWPAQNGGYTPLYTIVTGTATITSVVDWRTSATVGAAPPGSVPTGTGFRHVTAGVEDGASVTVDLSGAHVTGILAAARFPALTGDVTTTAGAVATTVANDAVTNAKLANVATATFKGRTTAGTGDPEDLTATQATAILNAVVGDSGSGGTKGMVPAPGAGDAAAGKYLKADGTFATPPGTGGSGDMLLGTVQVVTALKTFGTAGGAVSKFALAGSTSGSTVLDASAVASGTVTLPAGTYTVGYLNIPYTAHSANYTTVLADAGTCHAHPSSDANARTFTIDSNANVAYPIGTTITFLNRTSQVLSIAITSDTLTLAGTTTTGTRSIAQNGIGTAYKDTTTGWLISGPGVT